jgi:hypothetical protein
VLTSQHLPDLGGVDLQLEIVEAEGEILAHLLALPGPVHEHGEILGAPAQGVDQLDLVFQTAPALEQTLRFRLILPDIGLERARLEPGKLLLRLGPLKDSSGDRRPVSAGPDSVESVRRGRQP